MMHSIFHEHPCLKQAAHLLNQLNPDQFEVYFQRYQRTKIDSKDQQIDSLSKSEDVGLAIRLIQDRRMGFSFTTSLEREAIARAVQTAFEISHHMPQDPFVGLHSVSSAVYPAVDNWDQTGVQVPLSEKIRLAKSLEAYCRQADSRITAVRSASISESCIETHLLDSSGEHIHHQSTSYTASVTCKAESEGESQTGSEFAFSNYLDSLPLQSVGESAARWAVELLGAKSAPTMKCPALLRNSVVADLVDFLSESFSAEQIDKGRSLLAGKLGQPIFAESVHLIDDGLLAGGMGTMPFDGEGVPSKKTHLVSGGFLSGLLYDCYYARKNNTQPTGCAVRGIKAPPSIGVSNLYLQGGKKPPEALVSDISKGILITDFMGLHTANPVTGDFSLGASGILIENGKLSTPVRGFAVAGNVLDVFRRITDLGNDLKFFGRIGAPTIRLSEISVGGV
ncbi:MAG: TldD/PmbA family protein [Bdellovibrionia bacterium]